MAILGPTPCKMQSISEIRNKNVKEKKRKEETNMATENICIQVTCLVIQGTKARDIPIVLLRVLCTDQGNLHLCKWYGLHAKYPGSKLHFSTRFSN